MLAFKVVPVFLFILVVGADKKIELQDIEEDNLKSEKETEIEKTEARGQSSGSASGPGLLPLEFLKNSGFLRYFESPTHAHAQSQPPQQQRYVQQYAVTEPPERPPVATPKVQYNPPTAQQAMVGYLSNVPMQIYLVPQYYNEQQEQPANTHSSVQYVSPAVAQVAGYPTAPEAVQTQTNYVEVPTYVAPTGKAFVQQYTSPVAYVSYAQPTVAPAQATTASLLTYQVPVMQYPTAIAAPPVVNKGYYQSTQFTDSNTVEEVQEEENPKSYPAPTEVTYSKPTAEFPRYYSSRTPIREEYRHSAVSELPHPNPLILKAQPSHLAHLPKALPMYRPLSKAVYSSGSPVYSSGSHLSSAYTPRPFEAYGPPFKRRPTSLLDSYIPSSVQIEYLKRGYTKDPLVAYEELASGRHFSHSPLAHGSVAHSSLAHGPVAHSPLAHGSVTHSSLAHGPVAHSSIPHPSISHSSVIPRHYERGFLPNQMYHTAAGGVTYGHYKRSPKSDKATTK